MTLDQGETVTDIQWLYKGLSDKLIAVYAHGVFMTTPVFSRRVRLVPEAGLVLSHATSDDAGNYTVDTTTHARGMLSNYRRTAVVHIATAHVQQSWCSASLRYLDAKKSQLVSFHAKLSVGRTLPTGQVIILDHVITNQGDAYNASSGFFTALYNGTYVLLASTGQCERFSSSYSADLDVMVGDQIVSSIRTAYGSQYGTPKTGSCHAVVHLSSGERAWLKSFSSSHFDEQQKDEYKQLSVMLLFTLLVSALP
ncbi:hypothetical protein BaRGS_00029706, partial [Batillaria attramentaria]